MKQATQLDALLGHSSRVDVLLRESGGAGGGAGGDGSDGGSGDSGAGDGRSRTP